MPRRGTNQREEFSLPSPSGGVDPDRYGCVRACVGKLLPGVEQAHDQIGRGHGLTAARCAENHHAASAQLFVVDGDAFHFDGSEPLGARWPRRGGELDRHE